jgi:hypothetical protein
MILRLARTDSSIDFLRLFSENSAFLMLNDWRKDQGLALKQMATGALTTAFEEIPETHGMELLRARFLGRLAAVCQAMKDLAGVAETADSVLEWAEAMGAGERRELVEEICRPGLMDGLLDAERRTGDDFDEKTVGGAIAR